METEVIFKIQFPIAGVPMVLAYTQYKDIIVELAITPELQVAMGKKDKAYFWGVVGDFEKTSTGYTLTTTIHLDRPAPDQDW
jgi:hypothetical protein